MKNKLFIAALVLMAGCTQQAKVSDAYGVFEATEITVSAESSGKILMLKLNEGDVVAKDSLIAQIDTVDLYLKKLQLQAQRDAIATKPQNVSSQVDVQKQQKENLLTEKKRIEKLVKDGAATTKQLDDINASINLVEKQIAATEVQNNPTAKEIEAIERQIAQVQESINRCSVKCPRGGTVLNKYMEQGEFAVLGKAIFKLADLNEMFLKVYVSGDQLPNIKIGQTVKVLIDKDKLENKSLTGTITWISQQAEFTPKIIQTKEERVNLVYAVKVKVANNGEIKIGMPGEILFK